MTKVHGKRYAYKFDFHGLMLACQAQAGVTLESTGPRRGPSLAAGNCHQYHSHLLSSGPTSSLHSQALPTQPSPPHYCWPCRFSSPTT